VFSGTTLQVAFCREVREAKHNLIRKTPTRSFFFGLALATAWAQGPQAPPPNEPVVLANASFINVRNGQVSKGTTIVLRNGTIESVGSSAAPSGIRSIDLRGKYVLPGLIDAHTHITDLASARRALESGVSTAREAGVEAWVDVGLREFVRTGAVAGPDIVATGYWIPPQLPEQAFLTDPSLAPLMPGVDTPDAVRQIVRSNLAHGVNWIKVFASGAGGPGEARRPILRRRCGFREAGLTPLEAVQSATILGAK
jgi:imidazolonepropionase-like amidohydrolase